MNKYIYSFIIPHHNCPHLLKRCIDSIPIRADIQVIIVDDASDADKKPIAIRDGVELYEIERNESKGAGKARNIGIKHAKGEWILFADSDDYYSDNFIKVLDRYVDTMADIVYFRSTYRLEGNEDVINYECWEERAYEIFSKSKQQLSDMIWLGLSMPCPWNKMYKRSYIESHLFRFEEIPMCNDMWFVSNAAVNIKSAIVIYDHLYNYIQYSTGITKKRRPLEHHIAVIRSDRRINKIKMRQGFLDLILYPGFNKEVVLRDFGAKTYIHLLLRKFLTDVPFILAVIRKVMVKLKLIRPFSISVCQK